MDKIHGVGLRIYPSGGRYMGHWKNGIRHGIGTMVWTSGHVYRGEWKCGAMNGFVRLQIDNRSKIIKEIKGCNH